MEEGNIAGEMDENMKGSTSLTRSTDLEHTLGLMEGNILESGPTANAMEKERLLVLMEMKERACGKKTKEFAG